MSSKSPEFLASHRKTAYELQFRPLFLDKEGNYVLCVVTPFFFIEAHRSSRVLIDKQANGCYYSMLANSNHIREESELL